MPAGLKVLWQNVSPFREREQAWDRGRAGVQTTIPACKAPSRYSSCSSTMRTPRFGTGRIVLVPQRDEPRVRGASACGHC